MEVKTEPIDEEMIIPEVIIQTVDEECSSHSNNDFDAKNIAHPSVNNDHENQKTGNTDIITDASTHNDIDINRINPVESDNGITIPSLSVLATVAESGIQIKHEIDSPPHEPFDE